MKLNKTVVVANRKGGTGKTTSTLNLGWALSLLGYSVLLVDLDSQANLSRGLGVFDPSKDEQTIVQPMLAYMRDLDFPDKAEYIKTAGRLHFISSNETLSALELEMVGAIRRESILKATLDVLKPDYDFILIDSGPSLGLLTVNALMAGDSVLIVSSPDSDSNEGTKLLIKSIQMIRRHTGHQIEVDGILMNMVVERMLLTRDSLAEARTMFGEVIEIYENMIPRTSQFGRAKMQQKSIFEYAPGSKGANAYLSFCKEYLQKGGVILECMQSTIAG